MTVAIAHPTVSGRSIVERLGCPSCGRPLELDAHQCVCHGCGQKYAVRADMLDLRARGSTGGREVAEWTAQWSPETQATRAQRFFSVYRRRVFAPAVRHFTGRYFDESGVFVEAGSGTSETSTRIDKRGGRRILVAMDLVPEVLERCDPVMDVRIAGDIFRMPFLDGSLDGIWNVGVMEHFPHGDIDRIMREFHRALRPGGRVILLWPAIFSVPQRMLRVVEWGIRRVTKQTFRFHPEEISQLRSIRHGRDVLARNGFQPLHVDPGLRSLMAFETIVGEKPYSRERERAL